MPTPTQKSVAERAGVSRATVSYVLSADESKRGMVSEATRERVLVAARELGYQPNMLGRGLKAGQSRSIGLLIPDLYNLHYLAIMHGVEEEAQARGYHVSLASASLDPERERQCLRSVLQRRFDGLIVLPTYVHVFTGEIVARASDSAPLVFVGNHAGLDSVAPDVRCGAEALIDYILGLGHRRIGIINGVAVPGMAHDRIEIYIGHLARAGLETPPELIRHVGPTISDGYEAANALLTLPSPPTAILAINDVLALGALRAIHEQGFSIPADVSLAGFDDTLIAAHLYPPLTTVSMHSYEVGRRAAQVLFERIKHPGGEPIQESIPTELVVRSTTGVPRNGHSASL